MEHISDLTIMKGLGFYSTDTCNAIQ